MGCLTGYNDHNGVHKRLRRDLGEENFEFLSKNKIRAQDGTDATYAVAAAIICIAGMRNTLKGLVCLLPNHDTEYL